MTPDTLARTLIDLVGGASNIETVTRCWARLRFELHDSAAAREGDIDALDDVVLAVRQYGQLQLVLAQDLSAVHAAVHRMLTEGDPS